MEKNKSLSARIKRRNKQGFKGEGNHKMFGSVLGDYRDENQNYKKFDKNLELTNLVNRTKKYKAIMSSNINISKHFCGTLSKLRRFWK